MHPSPSKLLFIIGKIFFENFQSSQVCWTEIFSHVNYILFICILIIGKWVSRVLLSEVCEKVWIIEQMFLKNYQSNQVCWAEFTIWISIDFYAFKINLDHLHQCFTLPSIQNAFLSLKKWISIIACSQVYQNTFWSFKKAEFYYLKNNAFQASLPKCIWVI